MTIEIQGGRLSGDPRPTSRTRNSGTKKDLDEAGIEAPFETPNDALGHLAGWSFEFNNYYWVARAPTGSALPMAYAVPLHEERGQEVRVAGHCGCPHPMRWYHPSRGFAGVPLYHVDSVEGLKALADAIRKWRDEMAPEAGLSVNDWQHAKARREEPPIFGHDCDKCRYMGRTTSMARIVEWYVCNSGREPPYTNRVDCRGSQVDLLNHTVIGRFGSEGSQYWSFDAKTIAEWYDPKNVGRNTGPSEMVDMAQDKILEFNVWSVTHRRPK